VLGALAFTRFAGSIDTLARFPGAHAPRLYAVVRSADWETAIVNKSKGDG